MKASDHHRRATGTGRPALRPYVEPPDAIPARQPAEPRQRWRVVYARDAGAPTVSQRDDLAAWEAGLVASGLPLVGLDGPRARPRLMFAAPLPQGVAAEHDVADVYLTRRLTIGAVRDAIAGALPPGHVLVDLHDVWLGVPPLPADAVAADYRVRLAPGGPDAWDLATAAKRLLARDSIQRQRPKGTGQVRYDLRPLLADLAIIEPGPPATLRIRVRFDPQLGNGRTDEVLAALGELLGHECVASSIVRERVIMAGET